jgi:hypothetical protein
MLQYLVIPYQMKKIHKYYGNLLIKSNLYLKKDVLL